MVLFFTVYPAIVALMSLVCFATYGFDKRRAVQGGRSVPERTLHLLALLGGWPGAVAAQRWFRHKTQKVSFRLVFCLVAGAHTAVVAAIAYSLFRWA